MRQTAKLGGENALFAVLSFVKLASHAGSTSLTDSADLRRSCQVTDR